MNNINTPVTNVNTPVTDINTLVFDLGGVLIDWNPEWLLIDRFAIEPAKAIYVDDNIRNVLPARELGFHGIHFRTPALFRKELEGLGVL
jgi:FMN phosphatase YigB (HAD superfamily)